jgi:predicted nuclease of predicted toxin-antitoxin system
MPVLAKQQTLESSFQRAPHQNLPLQIASGLRNLGHDIHTTQDEKLSGCNDPDLWRAAQQEGRLLITQDLDFSDESRFAPGTHHGIVLIRLRSPSRRKLIERVEEVFQYEIVSTWPGCFVVVTEQKVRVRRALHQPPSL